MEQLEGPEPWFLRFSTHGQVAVRALTVARALLGDEAYEAALAEGREAGVDEAAAQMLALTT
jgi:hypothetical protein